MRSRKTLGVVALVGVAVAAVSFAVVDVTTSISRACQPVGPACAHEAIPVVAVAFAALGVLALAVGIVPAFIWIVDRARQERREEVEAAAGDPSPEDAEQHRRALDEDPEPPSEPSP